MSTPIHTLVVAEADGSPSHVIECHGIHRHCASYKPCEHPECVAQRIDDEDAYWTALEKSEGLAHGESHRLVGDDDEWMISTGVCYFAGPATAEQISTGHAAPLPAGRYSVACLADEDAPSVFCVVDSPLSVHKRPGWMEAVASR